ncbi:pectin acetylesterase, family CE10 [Flammeovirgaceae bacterium 311]|nr:pectin acetylesterase, family CE10 [Flammeovirgaceae bacterium 311]
MSSLLRASPIFTMKHFFPFLFFFLIVVTKSMSQSHEIPLWGNAVPNYLQTDEKELRENVEIVRISKVQQPAIEVYLPVKRNATGQAVVICPGGGYGVLAYDWEGTDIAKWLNTKGIAAIVLKYRLPNSRSVLVRHEVPLQDAQRALRLVRYRAKEWNIDPAKIGIMGFSAGGHLASTLGTHFDQKIASNTADAVNALSARPDFMVLIYPVITMKEPYTHKGSRNSLLGENPDQQLVDLYSNELQVKPNTPPTFIVHSTDDEGVPVENSLLFYEALRKNKIPAEMHIYPMGGHGYSLGLQHGYLKTWPDRLYDWLQNLK